MTLDLRWEAWYGDAPLRLPVPAGWDLTVHAPRTPGPLTARAIQDRLEHPVGQPPIRDLAAGKSRPLLIVDDLTRPTPAAQVIPFVLAQLADAGIPAESVRILMAKGAHGPSAADALERKVGTAAAARCRLLVHDYRRNLVRAGRTSFGSDVWVNREVLASDLVIGVSGIYPQHSTGFGGGSKLVLGVLGRRTIIRLHYGHDSMEGEYRVDNSFRQELDEIAHIARLNTMVSVHLNADREIVRMVAGDHFRYYPDAVAFSMDAYTAPLPGDADVVIANAYPMDVSLTFMRSKGLTPLYHTKASASRVVIAANPEGIGKHELFPFLNGPRFDRQRQVARRLSTMTAADMGRRLAARARRRLRPNALVTEDGGPPVERRPITLLTRPAARAGLPSHSALWHGSADRLSMFDEWQGVLDRVAIEQASARSLGVAVYPCAPIQVLDLHAAQAGTENGGMGASESAATGVR